jgi:hypothetical protein
LFVRRFVDAEVIVFHLGMGNLNPLQAELPNAEPRKHRITVPIILPSSLRQVFNINEFPIEAHNHKVLLKYSRRV